VAKHSSVWNPTASSLAESTDKNLWVLKKYFQKKIKTNHAGHIKKESEQILILNQD
jgi:hypothetical protein